VTVVVAPTVRSQLILGLDPGSGRTGYGVIRRTEKAYEYIECGCLSTSQKETREQRLLDLFTQVDAMIVRIKPDVAAVEELFFCRNVTTAMVVGEARGVLLLACAKHRVPIAEYSPSMVKQYVTGYGNASKSQVCEMVMNLLDLTVKPKPDDASDGLAIALCQLYHEDLNA
jgi:crossover junction endodeoxyribonuclease RuvC